MTKKKNLSDFLSDFAGCHNGERVKLVCPFTTLSDITENVLGANCVMFTMTNQVAEILCNIQKNLPQGVRGIDLDMPSFLSVGVRTMYGFAENVTALGPGDLDDIVIGDGYFPDVFSLHISSEAISLSVSEVVYTAIARMPQDSLLIQTRQAATMTPEETESLMNGLFADEADAPGQR